jgi:hypothetical protein
VQGHTEVIRMLQALKLDAAHACALDNPFAHNTMSRRR